MSYYKVKSITRKPKENKIYVTVASNNVHPMHYTKCEYAEDLATYEEKLQALVRDINCGELQLHNSLYDWRYAEYKTMEEMRAKYGQDYRLYELTSTSCQIYSIGETYSSCDIPITEEDLKNGDYTLHYEFESGGKKYYNTKEYEERKAKAKVYLEEYYNVFMKYLEEKVDGKYYLYSEDYGYITPKGNKGAFYYDLHGSADIDGIMDYKKAYCFMCKTGIKSMKVKKVETREYQPTKEQVQESKNRLELLGLETISKLQVSDGLVVKDIQERDYELIREINNFEKEYGYYVYYVIKTTTSFGKCYSMLYVSSDQQDWESDRTDLKNGECYAYVYNRTNEECSEIGLIGIKVDIHNSKYMLDRTF